ncbi:MAG: 3-hydroxybutyryl-CoA dehydrogenase, partial [Myxococcales bacterium]|nr:3-hydroxybutyryl-CoA dehydrogenase [Myxococcales bacterium]
HGIDVVVREQDAAAVDAARARIQTSLERALKGNKISAEEAEQTEARMQFTTDYDAMNDRQLVVEAVFEDEATKVQCFRQLDGAVKSDDAILASNTSSIPIMKLAVETKRPAFVCGIHFFNPVPVLELVELVPSLMTSIETAERAARFASEQLGKVVVRSQDRAGFVVNALLIPYILSAIRMAESGFATPEDIDAGMVKGCNHPMGPLALADLIGLDTTMAVAQSMYEEFKEPLFAPPPMLCRMVEAGLLGRKSKRGFYQYQR